jgi:hypothetical protein
MRYPDKHMRVALAVLFAPLAVPAAFRVVLGFYVHRPVAEAAPLLPGWLGVILYLAYIVTIVIALPIWLYLHRRGKTPTGLVTAAGLALGLLAGAAFVPQTPEWPVGLLLWSGALGGGITALVFHVIARGQRLHGVGVPKRRGGWLI